MRLLLRSRTVAGETVSLRTKTDGADMRRSCSDVDGRNYFHHEFDNELPVVDAGRIGIPYAARIIDHE